jgi:predicted dehydrogenase
MPDKWSIVSLCDCNAEKLALAKKRFNVQDENCFLDEVAFFEKKRADVLVVATQDRDHVRMGIRALELGYSVLLEKPISPIKEELEKLLEAKKKYGALV